MGTASVWPSICAGRSDGAAGGIEVKIARCFAFVGPYLPLDAHFAVGNFIRDGLRGGPIVVRGDGTPLRSYLYTADLAAWLWTILFRGASLRPYNVGSAEAGQHRRIGTKRFSGIQPNPRRCGSPQLRMPPASPGRARYVPSVERAQRELGLEVSIGQREAIRRTVAWHRVRGR